MIELVMDYEIGQLRIKFEDGVTKVLPVPKLVRFEEVAGDPASVTVTFPGRHVKFSTVPREDSRLTSISG